MRRTRRRQGHGFGSSISQPSISSSRQQGFDRRWFRKHPAHVVLLRPPTAFEIEDCRKNAGKVASIVLIYPLAEGARYRTFGCDQDVIEVQRVVKGQPQVKRQTVAELLSKMPLPYGSRHDYSLCGDKTSASA